MQTPSCKRCRFPPPVHNDKLVSQSKLMPCAGSVCAMQPVVPVFDNLTAALQDKRTARYRLGEDGARLELSKPLGQGLTSTVYSAPWAKSAVVKVVLPNICHKRNTSCPYVAFIVMGRAAGVPLAALL